MRKTGGSFVSFIRLVTSTVGGFHGDSFIPTGNCPSRMLVGGLSKERLADTAPQARKTQRIATQETHPARQWP